jgi:single-strand DNA-binding protein
MSLNLNHVVLAGNLTRDPDVKQINADRVVANAGIAINRKWKNQTTGELQEEVTFVDIEAWGRTAELIGQFLKKGSPVYIEGRLRLDQWEEKDTGQKRSRLKVVVESVQFLATRERGEGQPGAAASAGGDAAEGMPAPAPSARGGRAAPARRAAAPAVAGAAADDAPF